MAYDDDKRLLEIPEATSIETDDFLYLDGATNGSRKLPTSMIPDLIPNATDSQKGLMSASDKDKLDNLAEVAESGSANDVAYDATGASIVTEDDVQGAISELDAKAYEINASLTHSQQNIILLNTTNVTAGANDSFYYKNVNTVQIFLDFTPKTASQTLKVCTLPVGCRPPFDLRYAINDLVHDSTNMGTAFIIIGADGDVKVYMSTVKRTFFNATFII